MIIDCRSEEYRNNPYRARVLVDGVEIDKVFYVDTDHGFVKTYAVAEDAKAIATAGMGTELFERGQREGWDMPIDGAVSKVVRGKVELIPIEDQKQ